MLLCFFRHRIQRSPSVALVHQSNTMNNNNNNPIGKDAGGNSLRQSIDKEMKNAEKDCAKLDNKRRKAEESVKRADVEYYTLCIRAERARVEWEMSVLRGSSMLQNHEHQRLESLKSAMMTYLKLSSQINPHLHAVVERLTPHVKACNVSKDLAVVENIRRVSEGPSEQLLPDFYCEHTTLAMNRDRRKQVLRFYTWRKIMCIIVRIIGCISLVLDTYKITSIGSKRFGSRT